MNIIRGIKKKLLDLIRTNLLDVDNAALVKEDVIGDGTKTEIGLLTELKGPKRFGLFLDCMEGKQWWSCTKILNINAHDLCSDNSIC